MCAEDLERLWAMAEQGDFPWLRLSGTLRFLNRVVRFSNIHKRYLGARLYFYSPETVQPEVTFGIVGQCGLT